MTSIANRITKLMPNDILVQKCKVGEPRGDGMREIGGIILPDRYWQATTEGLGYFEDMGSLATQFVEILAIGDNVDLWQENDTRHGSGDGGYGVTVFAPLVHMNMDVIDEENGIMVVKGDDVLLPVIVGDNDQWIPVADYVVLKLDVPTEYDGIMRADSYTFETNQGEVIAVGPDMRETEVGHHVILEGGMTYHKFGTTDGKFACPRERQIVARIG